MSKVHVQVKVAYDYDPGYSKPWRVEMTVYLPTDNQDEIPIFFQSTQSFLSEILHSRWGRLETISDAKMRCNAETRKFVSLEEARDWVSKRITEIRDTLQAIVSFNKQMIERKPSEQIYILEFEL